MIQTYHLLDGGVYDNPDITIQRAMDMVIADLKEPRFSAVTEQYYRDEYLQVCNYHIHCSLNRNIRVVINTAI